MATQSSGRSGYNDPVVNIQCVLEKYSSLFGIDTSQDALVLFVQKELSGNHLYVFRQTIETIPVFSSSIRVVLTPDDQAISGVFSSYIKGAYSAIPTAELENISIPYEFPQQVEDAIASSVGGTYSIATPPELIFLLDRKGRGLAATPVLAFRVSNEDGELYRVRTDYTGSVLQEVKEIAQPIPTTRVKTRTAYPTYSTTTCSGTCSGSYDYCLDPLVA